MSDNIDIINLLPITSISIKPIDVNKILETELVINADCLQFKLVNVVSKFKLNLINDKSLKNLEEIIEALQT